MAARGAFAKESITNQILAAFPGSFKYDKEIRIPVEENGETIQIKVALTAAKVNVEVGEDIALPGTKPMVKSDLSATPIATERKFVEPTAEEKHNVSELLSMLGM